MKLLTKVKRKQLSLKAFFICEAKSDTTNVESAESLNSACTPRRHPSTSTAGATIMKFVQKEDVLAAKGFLSVKTVVTHYSTTSSANTGNIFQRMFPDSKIAQNLSCGKTKCSYLISLGLAPYINDILMLKLGQSSVKYIISFVESLNKVLESEQMDIIIWFLDNQEHKVCSRYFDSKFLGHITAEDLLQILKSLLDKLNPANLIQISIEGLHNNWKLLEELVKDGQHLIQKCHSLLMWVHVCCT